MKLLTIPFPCFLVFYRLFELGFQEQLNEILSRMSSDRQTLLFSATLPKQLVEFAKAGLNDPTLIRLDVDTKLSDQLKVHHYYTDLVFLSFVIHVCILLLGWGCSTKQGSPLKNFLMEYVLLSTIYSVFIV